MLTLDNIFIATALFTLVFMVFFYLMALIKVDYSIVDVGWGLGYVGISVVCSMMGNTSTAGLLLSILVMVWGIRLSSYLFVRNRSIGEDYRYVEMKKGWGKHHQIHAFFKVFMLQGLLMYLIALPIILSHYYIPGNAPGTIQILGLIVATIGLTLESVADWQLFKFKSNSNNLGMVLSSGLWKYSRHPNYFGETVFWWGIFMLAQHGNMPWYAIVSPILITLLLLKVSGVTLLEKKLSKNPKYRSYQQSTNAFIPWKPREIN